MPSAPQPDSHSSQPSSQPTSQQSSEVVEVFTGDTLEQAMAYAVASLGPDLAVRRARKIRKGVQGLVGKDRYEVVAAPPPAAPSTDAVGSAFDALLSRAEQAEEGPVTRVRRTTRPSVAAEAPHPDPAVAQHVEPAPFPVLTRATAAPTPPAKKAPTKRGPRTPKAVPATGWSRQALTDLGLPTAVLDALPADEPGDDLAWVVALAVALSAVLPVPAALGADNPIVVNGYGMAGVLGVLDAATRGLTPGTITVGDRTAAATATELALAVRAAVIA